MRQWAAGRSRITWGPRLARSSVPVFGTVVQGDTYRHDKLGDFTDLLSDGPDTVEAPRIRGDNCRAGKLTKLRSPPPTILRRRRVSRLQPPMFPALNGCAKPANDNWLVYGDAAGTSTGGSPGRTPGNSRSTVYCRRLPGRWLTSRLSFSMAPNAPNNRVVTERTDSIFIKSAPALDFEREKAPGR